MIKKFFPDATEQELNQLAMWKKPQTVVQPQIAPLQAQAIAPVNLPQVSAGESKNDQIDWAGLKKQRDAANKGNISADAGAVENPEIESSEMAIGEDDSEADKALKKQALMSLFGGN